MEGANGQTDIVGVWGWMLKSGSPDWSGDWGPLFTPTAMQLPLVGGPSALPGPGSSLIVSLELHGSPVLQQRRVGGTGGPPDLRAQIPLRSALEGKAAHGAFPWKVYTEKKLCGKK